MLHGVDGHTACVVGVPSHCCVYKGSTPGAEGTISDRRTTVRVFSLLTRRSRPWGFPSRSQHAGLACEALRR